MIDTLSQNCQVSPFRDNEFSLVVSSHFLFVYDDRLSYEFHRNCIHEMLRVSSEEVRVFPLVGLGGKRSLFVERIIKDDVFGEVSMQALRVPYEFFRGASEMLIITKGQFA